MGFSLGSSSRKNLVGVHPDLVKVVEGAILLTRVDFSVFEGLRTPERQRKLFDAGASTTLESKHIVQKDGFGHAVDLVPYIDFDGDGDKELRWDWPLAYVIADAVRKACIAFSVRIRWGGCWDIPLNDINDPEEASAAYVLRRKEEGRRAFLDGPHIELL